MPVVPAKTVATSVAIVPSQGICVLYGSRRSFLPKAVVSSYFNQPLLRKPVVAILAICRSAIRTSIVCSTVGHFFAISPSVYISHNILRRGRRMLRRAGSRSIVRQSFLPTQIFFYKRSSRRSFIESYLLVAAVVRRVVDSS